jgi:hypothetical protein
MKLIIKSVMILIVLSGTIFAQGKYTEFKVGILGPKDTPTGFFGGINFGRSIDQNLGLGLEVDVYKKGYTKEEKIDTAQAGFPAQIVRQTFDQSAWMFPVFLQFQYLGEMMPSLHLKVTAGLGYELLFTNYQDYETGADENYFFHGFAWHVDVGTSYPLSRASDIFAEVLYHGGKPSKSEEDRNGFPIRTEMNMNGLGLRIGLRVYNFGF